MVCLYFQVGDFKGIVRPKVKVLVELQKSHERFV